MLISHPAPARFSFPWLPHLSQAQGSSWASYPPETLEPCLESFCCPPPTSRQVLLLLSRVSRSFSFLSAVCFFIWTPGASSCPISHSRLFRVHLLNWASANTAASLESPKRAGELPGPLAPAGSCRVFPGQAFLTSSAPAPLWSTCCCC